MHVVPVRGSFLPSFLACLLLRALEIYEVDHLDFAEAHPVACVETHRVGRVASFDRTICRVNTVERVTPT